MLSTSKALTIGVGILASTLGTKASEPSLLPNIEKVQGEVARALGEIDLSKNQSILRSIERYCKSTHPKNTCEVEKIVIAHSLPGHISITYQKGNSQYEVHPQFPKEKLKEVKFGELNF